MSKLKLSKKHKYTVGKKKLESVTEFLHQFFEPFDSKAIAKKLSFFPKNRAEKKGVRFWLKKWKQSSDEGSAIHKEIEEYILTGKMPEYDKSEMAIKFLNKDFEGHDIHPEVMIHSEELGLAGTIDAIIDVAGGIVLVDWKTNESIRKIGFQGKKGILPPTAELDDCNYIQYCLQLNIYSYILEKYYGTTVKGMYLVHLEDTTYTLYDIPDMYDIVEEMIKYKNEHSNNLSN